jgi:YesN/AraC family two-component response regulator
MCEKIEDMNIVMHSMLDDFCDRVQSTLSTNSDNPTIQRALHYINDNIHKKIKVEDIAKKLHINPSYLSSKFKKNTGISLPSYINAQKINEAKHLLAFSDKPIIEISNYLSFSSQSYFQNQFKKITGMTPIEYRNSEQ